MTRQRVALVVITKDEADVLERCVRSASMVDEVVVVDSGSSDDTVAVAEAAGARVLRQEWLGYSRQKNAGAAAASCDWVLSLDADEMLSPELARSIARVLESDPDPRDGWYLDRRDRFLGVLVTNPDRPARQRSRVRLYHRAHSSWNEQEAIHEQVVVPGEVHRLDGLLHHDRGFTVDDYLRVFNRNGTAEAEALRARGARPSALKVLLMPLLRFLYVYLVRGDVRNGAHGLVHSVVKAQADVARYAKHWEASVQERQRP